MTVPYVKTQIPPELMDQIRGLAAGTADDKLRAIQLLAGGEHSLSEDAVSVLLDLANPGQPEDVRLRLASLIEERKLPMGVHLRVSAALRQDPSEEVRKRIRKDQEKWWTIGQASESFISTYAEGLSAASKALTEWGRLAESATPDQRYVRRFGEELKSVAHLSSNLQDVLKAASILRGPTEALTIGKSYTTFIDTGRAAQSLASALTVPTLSFYSREELTEAEEPPKPPPAAGGKRLAAKLGRVPLGKKGWDDYQDVCEELLNYCLAPPLMPAQRQVRTSGGVQIRDLLFHIPFDIGEFWSWLRFKFSSMALIVECKNYVQPLKSNQIVISSKYLGRHRLGQLGIVFSRKGLSSGAMVEQKRLWYENNDLVVSLGEAHLLKMLELKDGGKDPAIVIDAEIRKFLELLE